MTPDPGPVPATDADIRIKLHASRWSSDGWAREYWVDVTALLAERDALRNGQLVAERRQSTDGVHTYLSTYCLHGKHTQCRLTCKDEECLAPCVCQCHREPSETEEVADG